MIGFGLFLGSFLYYGLRAASGPAWLDGSEFVATSHLLAVPHPTGSPIYLVLAKLAQLLPIGTPSIRLAWLSALFAALAVERLHAVAAWLCTRAGGRSSMPANVAAILFALTPGMLAIGHRAELYSLELFLCLAAVKLALELRETGDARAARSAALVLGLALVTHPYLAALALPGLLLIAGRALWRRQVLLASAGFVGLAGLTTGVLALRGRAGGLIGWGDAAQVGGFIDILLGRAFQKGFAAPMGGTAFESLALFGSSQLGIAGSLLLPVAIVVGLYRLWRQVPALAAGVGLVIALGFASRGLWPFDHMTPDTAGYFGLSMAFAFAMLAVALASAESVASRRPELVVHGLSLATAVVFALSIGRPSSNDLEGDAGRELGLRALARVEPKALVVLDDFNLLFMTWYLQAVEGARPDVTVVFGGFLKQPWYQDRLRRSAPDALAALASLPDQLPPRLAVDYGIGSGVWPVALRAQLRPLGLLLGTSSGAASDDVHSLQRDREQDREQAWQRDWMVGRDDLDPQTRRALIWLHFRHACRAFDFGEAKSITWHVGQIEALHPGVGLGAALQASRGAVCRGG